MVIKYLHSLISVMCFNYIASLYCKVYLQFLLDQEIRCCKRRQVKRNLNLIRWCWQSCINDKCLWVLCNYSTERLTFWGIKYIMDFFFYNQSQDGCTWLLLTWSMIESRVLSSRKPRPLTRYSPRATMWLSSSSSSRASDLWATALQSWCTSVKNSRASVLLAPLMSELQQKTNIKTLINISDCSIIILKNSGFLLHKH